MERIGIADLDRPQREATIVRTAIQIITQDRTPARLEMEPDLVRPARDRMGLDQGEAIAAGQHLEPRFRLLPSGGVDAEPARFRGIGPNGIVARPTVPWNGAIHDSDIGLVDVAALEEPGVCGHRARAPDPQQNAARLGIQTVDETKEAQVPGLRPPVPVLEAGPDGEGEVPARVDPVLRCHHPAAGLVDHKDGPVLVQDWDPGRVGQFDDLGTSHCVEESRRPSPTRAIRSIEAAPVGVVDH